MGHPYFAVATPTVIGHRGAAGEAPENTLPSFARALAAGAAILESDVHLTRDGVPVLLHDDGVERTTDGRGASPSSRSPSCRRSTPVTTSARTAAARTRSGAAGVRVPTLAQALAAFPGRALQPRAEGRRRRARAGRRST